MKVIPQGRYTKEFREEAVKLVVGEGLSWAEAARRLSLLTSTLGNWVKAAKAGKLGDVGKNYWPLTEVEMELARTKKELTEVKMERDILRKQPRTWPGSRCPLRDDERTAARLSGSAAATYAECIGQWLLRMGRPAGLEPSAGGTAPGG